MKKTNYIIIILSVALIAIGLLLMHGSSVEVEYNPDIFSFRRITIAPIVMFLGYILMIFGIMYRRK